MNKILMGAFGAVVVSVGGIVAESIRELAMESTNNRIAREIANAVADAVAYVSQVYVDGLKLAGSFDEEAQKQALSMALAACLVVFERVGAEVHREDLRRQSGLSDHKDRGRGQSAKEWLHDPRNRMTQNPPPCQE